MSHDAGPTQGQVPDPLPDTRDRLRQAVRERYGTAARRASAATLTDPADAELSDEAGCCGGPVGCGCGSQGTTGVAEEADVITRHLYGETEASEVPEEALRASLGCGNPTALAELHPGEVVLDLGSGGGIDVLLSARRVGPTGKAYGVDMTDEMLELARRNARQAGAENVEFLKGEIEELPLPDASVDVIISNCVINLSADKRRVLEEAFRVLRPGGRFAVSDVVVRGPVPSRIRRSMELWIGCVAGALEEAEYRDLLKEAGFVGVDLEPTRVYAAEDARPYLTAAGLDADAVAADVDGRFMAAFVRARKPAS